MVDDNTNVETLDDGTQITTTVNGDGSKIIVTSKPDGSIYTTTVSSDGETVTTEETVAPTNTNTNTTSTNTNTNTDSDVEDTRTAVQRIKGTDTFAPDEIIGKLVNVEIDGFQFVAEEISLSESFSRRNLIRTSIMGGGEQTSRGEFVPRSFSFETSIDYPDGKPDEYDKLWAYMSNKECKVVSSFISGDMTADVQIQKTYPKGMVNTVKLSISVTEISQKDNTYTVKTDMGDFTSITDNSSSNIREMEDEDGTRVTVQTNVSSKHTSEMSKNLKEVSKENTTTSTSSTNTKTTTVQADSTNNTTGNNTNEYVSKDVTIQI